MPAKKTKDSKKSQRQRSIDVAREAGASEDEAVFDETLKRVAQHKPKDEISTKKNDNDR